MPRCRWGRACNYHARGMCRFYHSPSPPPPPIQNNNQRCRSRSRSRDRNNNSNNNDHVNLILKIRDDFKEQDEISNEDPLQFMGHGDSKKRGKMNMKQTPHGLEMIAMSKSPTRIGRCSLMTGQYYYEVVLQSTPCNSRIGWGLHTQNVDDENGKRIGEDSEGYSYNGNGSGSGSASKFWMGRKDYGKQWNGTGDVISCALDIDSKQIRFYLNGEDLGVAFSGGSPLFDTRIVKGVAPSISVFKDCKILVVTNKEKFKYEMPNGYSAIQTGFKMTWSRINDRVTNELGNNIGKMLRQVSNTNIDASQIEEILNKLPLGQEEKAKLKEFVGKEFDFVPIINAEIKRNNVSKLLENRGFKLCHIAQVLNDNYNGGDISAQELNILVSKCVERESKEIYESHIKNWKQWNCNEVIEWINTLDDGRFVDEKYSTFKQYLKMMKVNGIKLETMDDLTLELLTLNGVHDRNVMVVNIDELTHRKHVGKELEPPKEYLDPISFELMSDPVICSKSGYTYDRNTILNQIEINGVDPFTRDSINEQDLIPNRVIKDCIDKWRHENNSE